MLEHKNNSMLGDIDSLVSNSVDIFKVMASDDFCEDKCFALEDIKHRCVKLTAKVSYTVIAKEVVAAGFAIAAQSGGILSLLGVVGSTIVNNFLFMVIGMFLKGVIAAGIVVTLFTKIVSYFVR